jgi:hypothetical protein
MVEFRRQQRVAFLALVGLAALSSAGCPRPVVPYSSADEFARAIFRIADEGDESEWGTLLTSERRAQGNVYVHDHFDRWQRLILEIKQSAFGGNLAIAKFRINEDALEFETEDKWVHLFRVEMQDGGWKINQD